MMMVECTAVYFDFVQKVIVAVINDGDKEKHCILDITCSDELLLKFNELEAVVVDGVNSRKW
jgi:hypothetical protein